MLLRGTRHGSMAMAVVILLTINGSAFADGAALAGSAVLEGPRVDRRERGVSLSRAPAPTRDKLCCGYPLAEEKGFALRFYWLAMEKRFEHLPADTEVYTPEGHPLGTFPAAFARALTMEGSGVLADGRVIHYAGRCNYGVGTCFQQLDHRDFPFGKGASRRTLIPFKSIAVDKSLISLGDAIYIPELDGMRMPDGTIHDGCVRADDTGGNIKQAKIDFFVMRYENFRTLLDQLYGVIWITPHVESGHCQYLSIR